MAHRDWMAGPVPQNLLQLGRKRKAPFHSCQPDSFDSGCSRLDEEEMSELQDVAFQFLLTPRWRVSSNIHSWPVANQGGISLSFKVYYHKATSSSIKGRCVGLSPLPCQFPLNIEGEAIWKEKPNITFFLSFYFNISSTPNVWCPHTFRGGVIHWSVANPLRAIY